MEGKYINGWNESLGHQLGEVKKKERGKKNKGSRENVSLFLG